MTAEPGPLRLVLMSVVLAWCGALGLGFAWVAATSSASLGPARTALFAVLAVLLLLVAARTLVELPLRRLLPGRRRSSHRRT